MVCGIVLNVVMPISSVRSHNCSKIVQQISKRNKWKSIDSVTKITWKFSVCLTVWWISARLTVSVLSNSSYCFALEGGSIQNIDHMAKKIVVKLKIQSKPSIYRGLFKAVCLNLNDLLERLFWHHALLMDPPDRLWGGKLYLFFAYGDLRPDFVNQNLKIEDLSQRSRGISPCGHHQILIKTHLPRSRDVPMWSKTQNIHTSTLSEPTGHNFHLGTKVKFRVIFVTDRSKIDFDVIYA